MSLQPFLRDTALFTVLVVCGFIGTGFFVAAM